MDDDTSVEKSFIGDLADGTISCTEIKTGFGMNMCGHRMIFLKKTFQKVSEVTRMVDEELRKCFKA